MRIRVTSVGNTEDGGWLIEFTRADYAPPAPTVVIALPREEGKDPPGLDTAINAAAGIARSYFEAMQSFNELAGAHDG
jgi:hypothetical protein